MVTPEQHTPDCNCRLGVTEWYREFAPVLRRYTLTSTGDLDAAEDCTHETFVRALAHRHRFECRGQGVRPWLFTIARNVALDYRKGRRVETLIADPPEQVDIAATPEERITQRERAAVVRFLISRLPADQACCLALRFFDDFSVRETAQAMRRRDVAVRALQYRAMQNLRPLLAGMPEDPW